MSPPGPLSTEGRGPGPRRVLPREASGYGQHRTRVNSAQEERVFIEIPTLQTAFCGPGTDVHTEALGFHGYPRGTDPARGSADSPPRPPPVPRAWSSAHQPLPSASLPSQERKAIDRAKRLRKSRELAGLAQFLGKHQAPRVPGSHFHSLKLLRALSTSSPGPPEAIWGQQRGGREGGRPTPQLGGGATVCAEIPRAPPKAPQQKGLGAQHSPGGGGEAIPPLHLGKSQCSSVFEQLPRGHVTTLPRFC